MFLKVYIGESKVDYIKTYILSVNLQLVLRQENKNCLW